MSGKQHTRKLRLRAWKVGWSEDLIGNSHPLIQIESSEKIGKNKREFDWTVYDHPTEGWQVTALVVTDVPPSKREQNRLLCEADEEDADKLFAKWIGVNTNAMYHEWLNEIAAEMHEIGRLGVNAAMDRRESMYQQRAEFTTVEVEEESQ